MSKLPKVSVVSVTYNQEKYVKDTLESFIAQKANFSIEVVIADDCSTDKTPEIIRDYAQQYPDIIKPIFREKNVGVLQNFLGAMRAARGNYIALCEGDDYWTDPHKLQKQADFLDEHKAYSMCFHPVKVIFENNAGETYISPDPKVVVEFTTKELVQRNFIQTNSVMYKKQTYEKMPNNIMPVDWYLHLYHAQYGNIGFINEVMSVYRRHPGGVWWESYKDMDKILRRHGVSWLGLHVSVLELYRDNPELKKIVEGSVINMFYQFMAIDSKYQENLVQRALAEFAEGGEIFIKNLVEQAKVLENHSQEQAKIIKHYVELSERLQAHNDVLEAKLLVRLKGAVKKRVKRRKG